MSKGKGETASRDFEPVTTKQEAERLLKEGVRTQASVMLWTKEQEQAFSSRLAYFGEFDRTITASKPSDLGEKNFLQTLSANPSWECFFSVSLLTANIFFKTKFLGFIPSGMRFSIPEKIFKVQRRKNARFTIPAGYLLKVDFQDPLYPNKQLTKKVVDISAGGLSFAIDEIEASTFVSGLKLENIGITLRTKKIFLRGEVRHARPVPSNSPHKGYKVGVSFLTVAEADAQLIASYVFDETRRFFTRFM